VIFARKDGHAVYVVTVSVGKKYCADILGINAAGYQSFGHHFAGHSAIDKNVGATGFDKCRVAAAG
jgi:hypothetical protein